MTLRLSVSAQNASTNAICALPNVTSAGSITIYSGTQPATPATAASGTLLATVTLAATSFGTSTAGVATLADPASVNAAATGTAGWFRMADGAGAVVMDGAVTVTGGGGDLTLSSVSLVSGSPVDLTGGTFTTAM